MTRGAELPPWVPDPAAVDRRERDAANLLAPSPGEGTDVRIAVEQGLDGKVRFQSYEVSATASGRKGRIDSTTRVAVIQDPDNPTVSVLTPSRNPLQELGPPIDVPAYPVRILYSRTIHYTDTDGRECTVEVAGNVHFTHETWQEQSTAETPSFDALQRMQGDTGYVIVRIDGKSPIPDFAYYMRLEASANSIRQQLGTVSDAPNINSQFSTLVSTERATFVLLDAPAGEQFVALRDFLFSADQREIERRLQAMLEAQKSSASDDDSESWLGSALSWLGGKIAAAWNTIPAPVRGVLKALGKIGLTIGAVLGTAALVVALSPVELAVGTVALVIGGALLAGSFISSLFGRSKEAEATGKGSTAGVVGAALGDATGVSGVYESVTNKSILSGTELGRSEEERWEGGTIGVAQVLATFLGARAAIKRTPFYGKTTEVADPSLPAGQGGTDAFGNVTYSPQGSAADVALVRHHEGVHSFLSPRFKIFRSFRARLGMTAYQRSALLRYAEEALAESYAQLRVNGIRGLPEGLRFPVSNGYVTVSQVVVEGAIGTIVYGGIVYGVYLVLDRDGD